MIGMDRREAMKRAGGGLVAAVAAGGFITASSQPAVAASGLTVSDVNVTTNDGELNALTVNPDVTVSWEGMEAEVATVALRWHVRTDSTSETGFGPTPEKVDVETPSKEGSIDHTHGDSIDLLGGPLSASNFEATTDGTSESTDVTLSMDAELRDSNSNAIVSKTDLLGPNTFTVTVTNGSSSVSASGAANTGGS